MRPRRVSVDRERRDLLSRPRRGDGEILRDDDKHVDKVARMAVELEKMERDVAKIKTNLVREEGRLRDAKKEMGEATFVVFGGSRYTREDLRFDARAFDAAEKNLKSKEDAIVAKRRHLTLEKKKLTELQTTRNDMLNELQRLETSLAEERQAQAASESSIDDSSYRKLRKDMDNVRDRIEILKQSRQLRGELRVPQVEAPKTEQTLETDRFIESRFSDSPKKEVVGK